MKDNAYTSNYDGVYTKEDNFYTLNRYELLYHGIRFQNYLEKLESIFKDGMLLAGKYIPNYYNYSDNCNMGEYVSLLNISICREIDFITFIEENISLLISPYCDAIVTDYVCYSIWERNKDAGILCSYMMGECMCKDYILLDYVKAIGVPYNWLVTNKGFVYTDKLIDDIIILMKKYNVELPIVDTSMLNKVLVLDSKGSKKLKYSYDRWKWL